MYIQLFISILLIQIVYNSTLPSPELHLKYGGQALNALERLLNFFELDADDINLDGVYGLRIAQGQLDILDEILTSKSNDNQIYITDKNKYIKSLSQQIERITNKSLKEIERKTSLYLKQFSILTSQPFRIEYEQQKIDENFIDYGLRKSDFDEDESDNCFSELLGSTNHPNVKKCFITQSCWLLMTKSMTKDYCLTHQLLWFLTAKNIGCIDNRTISNLANKNLKNLERYYCTNIYQDAKENFEKNFNQDLFLEQLLLCSIIGYEEFLRYDWFQIILTWQNEKYGCFINQLDNKRKRHLLIEQEMNNGCLSHKSGLASGVLAVYARAFLQ